MQGRKRKLPSFMQPKSPAPEPQPTSKRKKSKNAPRQTASQDTEVPEQVPKEKQCKDSPGLTGSLNTKARKPVQTQLSFKKKPVQDRSHAFTVKPEPPKLPSLSPPESASAVRCAWHVSFLAHSLVLAWHMGSHLGSEELQPYMESFWQCQSKKLQDMCATTLEMGL